MFLKGLQIVVHFRFKDLFIRILDLNLDLLLLYWPYLSYSSQEIFGV